MRKSITGKGAFLKGTLFASLVLLLALTFHACQQEEVIFNTQGPQDVGAAILNSSLNPDISLVYPEEVTAGEDFDITFSSTCGRIMIERGFTAEFDEYGAIISKVYTDLTCDTENLLWEAVGDDVFETCLGTTITQNLAEPGTYVYRAKLNFKAIKKSGCSDCAAFAGNKFECFMITVVAGNQNEGTFTDTRDGHVYKWVKIGNQIWMAENLAHNAPGSYAYNNDESYVATFGRLYSWDAAMAASPAGWHLPSKAEWDILINYLTDNGYGYEGSGDDVAKALASTTLWNTAGVAGVPGYLPENNNSSGFSGLPGGYRNFLGQYQMQGYTGYWWSSDQYSTDNPYNRVIWNTSPTMIEEYMYKSLGFSVRCIKD